jgi:hypothetical protein
MLIVSEKDRLIVEKRYESKNLEEKLELIDEEIQIRTQEYKEKLNQLEKIQMAEEIQAKKNGLMKNNSTELPSNLKQQGKKEKVEKKQIEKIVELYNTTKSAAIVEKVSSDFQELKALLDKIYDQQKSSTNEEVGFVYIKYEDSVIPFRLIDEYYSFSDLLVEVTRYFNLKAENHRIFDQDGNMVHMIISVKSYLSNIKAMTGTVPNLFLICLDGDNNIEPQVYNKEKLEHDILAFEDNDKANLLIGIEEVENEILAKLKDIIFYLCFLFIIFVFLMSRYKIEQSFYIYHSVEKQITESQFYVANKNGLKNSFSTVESMADLDDWAGKSWTDFFKFPDSKYFYYF